MGISVTLHAAGNDVEAVVLLPPCVASAADVSVEVLGEDHLLIECMNGEIARVTLPVPVDPDTGRVRFRRAAGKLTFTAKTTRGAAVTSSIGTDTPESVNQRATAASLPACQPTGCSSTLAGEPQGGRVAATSGTATVTTDELRTAETMNSGLERMAEGAAKPHQSSMPIAAPSQPLSLAAVSHPRLDGTADVSSNKSSDGGGSVSQQHQQHLNPDDGGPNNDAELYADFYCNSPPGVLSAPSERSTSPLPVVARPLARAAADTPGEQTAKGGAATTTACDGKGNRPDAEKTTTFPASAPSATPSNTGDGDVKASINATKVAAAFAETGGTSSRMVGFSFTAPDLPPPPPLPPGLPPVATPIDCRYLAVANALRISAHSGTAALAEMLGLRRRPSAAAERRKNEKVEQILQRVAETLDAYGYAVLDNYISEASVLAARKELQVMEPHYSPGMIWVGKEAEAGAQISVSSVRGDVVLWLDDQALNATAFMKDGVRRDCSFMQLQQLLADVDELVFEGLRPRLPYLAGLHRRSDAMMAVYPGKGARFAKHVDNTTMDGRRLTVLTYLNPGWQEQQGGALRLSPVRKGAACVVDVLPLAGRVALFLSAEVAHEVMPAFASRHAVTLWYFDAGEHAAALTAAKVLPGASSRPSAQAAATALLRDLLADEASSGIEATPEGCAALGTRVAALEQGAQELLAAVLGLPDTNALVESMRGLTPDSLRRRREDLRNMGLGTQHHAPDTTAHVG